MNQYAPSQTAGAFVICGRWIPLADAYDNLWRCTHCRRWFVVPSLARHHEQTCPTGR